MIYGFNSEDVAQELKRIGLSSIGGEGTDPDPTGLEVIFVKTPSAGIAGKEGSGVMSEGECTLAHIDDDEFSDDSDTVDIINTGTDALSGDTYIAAVKSGVNWVPIVGGGGGGGGNNTFQMKTTTAVSAGDPTDGTVGSGSANMWTFNGTSFGIDSSALFDVVNPWATTVSSNIMITVYQHPVYTDKYILMQAECEETTDGGGGDGGTDPPADPEGYCINDTTGAVTSGVLQSACTGTWSSTEPTTGCCDISGTQHENVAQSWCTTNSGTFTSGACVPPAYDPCPENAKFTISNFTLEDNYTPNCATTPWVATAGSALGLVYQTGCLKRFYHSASISSSENPAVSGGVVDGDVTYRSSTNDWLIDGQLRYSNSRTGGTTTVDFTGIAPHVGTDCATTTITASIAGDGGNYDQPCDFTDATVLVGTITLQLVCN